MGGRTRAGSRGASEIDTKEHDADEFIAKVAQALLKRGGRRYQVKEVSTALHTAASALPDSATKAHLLQNLSECAAALHNQLSAAHGPEQADTAAIVSAVAQPSKPKRAKRSKPAEVVAEAPAAGSAGAPTLLDSTLQVLVERSLAGNPDPAVDPVALLVARFPPPPGYLEWHILRGHPAAGASDDVPAILAAADFALRSCNALAGQADHPSAALAAFGAAVALMCRAARVMERPSWSAARQQGQGQGSGCPQEWVQLAALSSRALLCMHAAAEEVGAAAAAGEVGGAAADSASRWWLQRAQEAQQAEQQAAEACAAVVSLCTTARLHTPVTQPAGRQGEAAADRALAALAALDMRRLAPYAAAGQLSLAAEVPLEEVVGSREGARCFLALYAAAAEQEAAAASAGLYLLRMAAARKAAAVAAAIDRLPAAAALEAAAAATAAPAEVVEWLRQQPPSSVVLAALSSLRQGPSGLSAHLVYHASDRAVLALAVAARSEGQCDGAGAGADGNASGGPSAADDLLYFVSTEGDAALLGEGWRADADNDAEEGGEGAGLDLGELPDSEEEGPPAGRGSGSDDDGSGAE